MYVFPISESRLLIETGRSELVYARVEKPERWYRLSRCSSTLPRVVWVIVTPSAVIYEHVKGAILADEVIEDLAIGRVGDAARKVWLAGYWLANLHSDLETTGCFEGEWDTGRLIEDRCRLASATGLDSCPRISWVRYMAFGHGDPHLYQAILVDERIVFIDLDGEPEVGVPGPPEYDVAVAARSLDYAANLAGMGEVGPRLLVALLAGYCRLRRLRSGLFEASYLARLVYEYYFEKARNTGLDWVPSRALESALEGRDPLLNMALRVIESCRE